MKNILLKENESKEMIKKKICDELRKLKYNFSYIGTRYFVEAIYILYILKKNYNCNFEKEIYPLIEMFTKTLQII